MVISELIRRSPIRVFEQAINGRLGPGELGVIAAPSGIGKTSVLVQIGLDKLLQGKRVIHVSFTQHTDYVLVWYKDLFNEFIKKRNLQNEKDVKNDIDKNRVLMKFNQEGLSVDQILKSIRALIKDGGFNADAVIVDGLNFSKIKKDHVCAFKTFAVEMGVAMWCSCTVKGEEPFYDKRNIPLVLSDYAELFEVIIVLEPKQDNITLTVSRARDVKIPESLALKLDPKTLLILEN
ncbi:MAG: AAA family ATPase [Treponema sp.]|nr:AAA family ATPase [Treponema sp.]